MPAKNRVYISFTYIVVISGLIACGIVPSPNSKQTISPSIAPVSITPSKPTQIQPTSFSVTPKITDQLARTQTIFTPIIVYTEQESILDKTPQPTLAAEAAREKIYAILKNNGGCELPCIWGMSPGKTEQSELLTFLSTIGTSMVENQIILNVSYDQDRGSGNIDFWSYEDFTRTEIYYSAKIDNSILTSQSLFTSFSIGSPPYKEENYSVYFGDNRYQKKMRYYSLPEILKEYGLPSRILIYASPNIFKEFTDNNGNSIKGWWMDFMIIYDTKGFVIEYTTLKEKIGTSYTGCPTEAIIHLSTWNSKYGSPSYLLKGIGPYDAYPSHILFKPIDEVTNLTISQFTSIFSNPESKSCVDTPINIWDNPE